MTEPKWLSPEDVEELQAIAIEKDGGLTGGLVKPDLLESALARPQNKYAYVGEQDMFKLAAAYAEGIAQNHAFADANKRTAFMAADIFLYQNGIELQKAKGREHADMMVKLTDKKITRDQAAVHLREHSRQIERERSTGELGKKDWAKKPEPSKSIKKPPAPKRDMDRDR
jgi:death-on-curing protein